MPTFGQNAGYTINFEDPKSVVNALFYAGQTQDFQILQCLCDPFDEGDIDTKEICSLSSVERQINAYQDGKEMRKKPLFDFMRMFASGRIRKAVTFDNTGGNQYAKVPILYKPPGKKRLATETMVLINRYGNWYLFSY